MNNYVMLYNGVIFKFSSKQSLVEIKKLLDNSSYSFLQLGDKLVNKSYIVSIEVAK